jgi:methionyl-tRNA formyltransferase
MKIALFVAGPKGANFLRNFRSDAIVELIVSYPSKGLRQDAYGEIQSICRNKGYMLLDRVDVRPENYVSVDLVLLIGWQWLTEGADQRYVVFHDSLLPKLRGFSPTVTALIAGETEIGVTAFSPIGGAAAVADSGPVFGKERLHIQYPVTIRSVYEQLGLAYCRLAERVIQAAGAGPLSFSKQDEIEATYSIWRDEHDYRINWAMSAQEISRFVDAVGWPYMGAKCLLQGREIWIDRVVAGRDLLVVNRCPGKIWSLAGWIPEVVCGSGMLRILEAREADGSPVIFKSLRTRME